MFEVAKQTDNNVPVKAIFSYRVCLVGFEKENVKWFATTDERQKWCKRQQTRARSHNNNNNNIYFLRRKHGEKVFHWNEILLTNWLQCDTGLSFYLRRTQCSPSSFRTWEWKHEYILKLFEFYVVEIFSDDDDALTSNSDYTFVPFHSINLDRVKYLIGLWVSVHCVRHLVYNSLN